MKRLTIQILNVVARRRGGRCVSKRYLNFRVPLLWQCAVGHHWKALATNVTRGSWCPDCAGVKRLTLREMWVLAKHRRGQCLSKRYVNNETKLAWRCASGHEWKAAPVAVKSGHWCPHCAHTVRLTLQKVRAVAAKRGGQCLSNEYVNGEKHLRWECAADHEWDATPTSIRKGSWCPYCVHNHKLKLEEMQQIARQRGGKCISRKYMNNHSALVWECRRGHRWKALPSNVNRGPQKPGTWCLKCYNLRRVFRSRDNIERMRELASKRGGRCLSDEYFNSKSRLNWECVKGHRWSAVPVAVARGSWCPVCAHNQRLTLRELRTIADRRGGECLSSKYTNKETKLKWQCAAGHEWFARPGDIKRGSWCNKCAINRLRSVWKHPTAPNVINCGDRGESLGRT
jgi:hypothetical protein